MSTTTCFCRRCSPPIGLRIRASRYWRAFCFRGRTLDRSHSCKINQSGNCPEAQKTAFSEMKTEAPLDESSLPTSLIWPNPHCCEPRQSGPNALLKLIPDEILRQAHRIRFRGYAQIMWPTILGCKSVGRSVPRSSGGRFFNRRQSDLRRWFP